MDVTIEFYRTRERDEAHAVLGRVERQAVDVAGAIEIARSLLFTLEMPQQPDAVAIYDAGGKQLYCRVVNRRTNGIRPAAGSLPIARKEDIDMNNRTNVPGKRDGPADRGTGKDGVADSMDHHYGLRVEADRSWTVYHVFTGVPADVGGRTMVGLGQAAATGNMLSMNLRNASRRRQRITLDVPRLDGDEVEVL
jgi:hypothetical protein